MTSRPLSKLKQLLLRGRLWWRYYQRNRDTIRPVVVDAISKVLACGRVIMGYASFVCSNHECTHTKKICFGCKARLCNTCGKKLTDQWIANQKALCPIPSGNTSPSPCRMCFGSCSNSTGSCWAN